MFYQLHVPINVATDDNASCTVSCVLKRREGGWYVVLPLDLCDWVIYFELFMVYHHPIRFLLFKAVFLIVFMLDANCKWYFKCYSNQSFEPSCLSVICMMPLLNSSMFSLPTFPCQLLILFQPCSWRFGSWCGTCCVFLYQPLNTSIWSRNFFCWQMLEDSIFSSFWLVKPYSCFHTFIFCLYELISWACL